MKRNVINFKIFLGSLLLLINYTTIFTLSLNFFDFSMSSSMYLETSLSYKFPRTFFTMPGFMANWLMNFGKKPTKFIYLLWNFYPFTYLFWERVYGKGNVCKTEGSLVFFFHDGKHMGKFFRLPLLLDTSLSPLRHLSSYK